METTVTAFGYAVVSSGGTATAAATVVVAKGNTVSIKGIICGGAATTDIIRVTDGDGNRIFQGSALVGSQQSMIFNSPMRVNGLNVGCSGATTGFCTIFTE